MGLSPTSSKIVTRRMHRIPGHSGWETAVARPRMGLSALSNVILRVAGLPLKQRHGVSCCGSNYAVLPVRIANNGFEPADRFVVPDVLDFDACRDRLSDPDSLHEPP